MNWKRDIALAIGAAVLVELVKWGVGEAQAAELGHAGVGDIEVPVGSLVGSDPFHFQMMEDGSRRRVLFTPTEGTTKLFGPRAPNLYDPSRGQFVFTMPAPQGFAFWTPPKPPRLAA